LVKVATEFPALLVVTAEVVVLAAFLVKEADNSRPAGLVVLPAAGLAVTLLLFTMAEWLVAALRQFALFGPDALAISHQLARGRHELIYSS
jgi:hypothetical protein